MDEEIKLYNEQREIDGKLEPCSETTVFRIMQDFTDSYEKDKGRHGVVQAQLNKHGVNATVPVERPLERVEIDWTPIDLLIVDTVTSKRKRHYLVYGIDVCTGYPLGFYISPSEPTTKAIKQCLLHIILPKVHLKRLYPKLKHDWSAYGVPETIVLDNAKVNESEDLEEICGFLGIEVQYCPVKAGHHKGKIERGLQTLNTKVFHKTPGTTFSNPQEKSQYNSDEEACITLRYLYELIYITLIELVANDYSIDNNGVPASLWHEGLKESRVHRILPLKKEHLIILLGSGIDYRTINNKGIEIQSQHYISPDLMKLFDYIKRIKASKEVRIRYDLSDMRVVYVWDEFDKKYISVYPTRHSLRKKGIDPNYPVHYEQIHAYSYNNEKEYRDFNTEHIGKAMNDLNVVVNESRSYLRELQNLSADERAIKFSEEIGLIEAGYQAQLAIDDISSLELVDEVIEQNNAKKNSKNKKAKEENVRENKNQDLASTNRNMHHYNSLNEILDEELFEVSIKKGRVM